MRTSNVGSPLSRPSSRSGSWRLNQFCFAVLLLAAPAGGLSCSSDSTPSDPSAPFGSSSDAGSDGSSSYATADGSSKADGASEGASPGTPLGAPENGIATYYAADGSGNCSYDPSPSDLMVAAMDAAEYANSASCGTCVAVTGPSGSVTVRIVDQCPECEKGHLDLSREAFAKIADVALGRVNITWTKVRCSESGPVSYRVKDGSNEYWTALQVLDHAVPIATFEVQVGGTWSTLPRADYNYFIDDKGVGTSPYRVRITATTGAVLEDAMPSLVPGQIVHGHAQFP